MNKIGQLGEKIAYNFLIKKGYNILENNYTVPFGEIDIIAEKNNCIYFIEVKCRKTNKYGLPEEAITDYKKKRIIRIAEYYIKRKNINNKIINFGVVAIQINENSLDKIKYFPNAFIKE